MSSADVPSSAFFHPRIIFSFPSKKRRRRETKNQKIREREDLADLDRGVPAAKKQIDGSQSLK
jgi:hypothetical protein